jgi:hypothetical protein
MEPLDEGELKLLLHRWEAPIAPRTLNVRVSPPPAPRWRWLLSGTVRVPVPVALGIAALLAIWIYHSRPVTLPRGSQPSTVSLSDFKPVRQLEPVLVSGGRK